MFLNKSNVQQLLNWNSKLINDKFTNRVDQYSIGVLITCVRYLQKIVSLIGEQEVADWIAVNVDAMVHSCLSIIEIPTGRPQGEIRATIEKFYAVAFLNANTFDGVVIQEYRHITLNAPLIEAILKINGIEQILPDADSFNNKLDSEIKKLQSDSDERLSQHDKEFNEFKEDANITLGLLKRSG